MSDTAGSAWDGFRRRALRGDGIVALVLGIGVAMAGLCAIVFVPESHAGFVGLAGGAAIHALWIGRTLFDIRTVRMRRLTVDYALLNLAGPALVAIPVAFLHLLAMFIPDYRAAVGGAVEGYTSFFSGMSNPIAQTIVILLVTWLFGALAVLALALLLLLPVVAILRPGLALEGSHIELVAPARQTLATRLIFVGLSPLVLGIVLWVFADEHIRRFPDTLGWVVRDIGDGTVPYGPDLAFVLGVILVFAGGAAVAAGCAIVLTARVNAAGDARR